MRNLVRSQLGLPFLWLIGCIVGIPRAPRAETFTDCRPYRGNDLTCECPDRDDLAQAAKEPNVVELTTASADANTAFAELAGLATLRKLNAHNVGQAHLIGIGQLSQLEELQIVISRGEAQPSLAALEDLRGLKVVRIGCRGTIDLTPLSKLASLRSLTVSADCAAAGLERFRPEVVLDVPNKRPPPRPLDDEAGDDELTTAEAPSQTFGDLCMIDPDSCQYDHCANRKRRAATDGGK